MLCSRDANVHFKEVRCDSKQELCREQNRKYVKLEFTTDDITDDHFENKIAPPETNTKLVLRHSQRSQDWYGEE